MEVSRARYLMGTVCEATALVAASDRDRAAAALDEALEEIARLERILSDWRDDSEMTRLNRAPHGAPFAASGDLFDFLSLGIALSRSTGGAFDMTVAPLVRLYDLRGSGRWPGDSEIAAALRAVGSDRLRLDPPTRGVAFGAPGMGIDPGALGKGYALDAAARLLRRHGIDTALLDFGGQVVALGAPAGAPGWTVALSHPRRRHDEALRLTLRDASLATSGNVERGRVVDGRDLGHVVDALSGRPVAFRGSASAVAATAAEADAFSTALLVMGPERGLAWAAGREGLTPIFLEEDPEGDVSVRAGAGLEKLHAVPARQEPAGPVSGGS